MTNSETQATLDLDDDAHDPKAIYLGLSITHRRLLNALQDGWLQPLEGSAGTIIGVGRYALEQSKKLDGNLIQVRIILAEEKLPNIPVHIRRGGRWKPSDIKELTVKDKELYWPSALPTFAFSEIVVANQEERARLTGMVRSVSNVLLPDNIVSVQSSYEKCFDANLISPEKVKHIAIPNGADAIQGAMSMAVWGVPRIDPWLDVLSESLTLNDIRKLKTAAEKAQASWWRFPPWSSQINDAQPTNPHEALWLAAIHVFRCRVLDDSPVRPKDLVKQIADMTSQYACAKNLSTTTWLHDTYSILRADSTIQWADQSNPVGMAIQLVLTRPEPTKFKTWFKDQPNLPPGVAWSAATLCGLLHGYKMLDIQFRGDIPQHEILSIHALNMYEGAPKFNWPSYTNDGLKWRKDSNCFVLSWDKTDFFRMPQKARGKWYRADFDDAKITQQAQAEAKRLGWQCVNREIDLKDVAIPIFGSGTVSESSDTKRGRQLKICGEVQLQVPATATIKTTFDSKLFQHCVVVEGGTLNTPISSIPSAPIEQPPGLEYIRNFITAEKEKDLVKIIDEGEWCGDMKRRVQHYGWRYDYNARQIDLSMKIGLLPDWARELAELLFSKKLVAQLPDQVIVNEYKGNQGISKHCDSKGFADDIATISLLESWEMRFQHKASKEKANKLLEQRSVAIMRGEVRNDWTHEIPKRKKEPTSTGKRKERNRRISLTFRKVIMGG